jgi:hypothetical protein
MCSSRIDPETGIVTITARVSSTMPVGYRLYLGYTGGATIAAARHFEALLESLHNGSVHPSLIAEPNGHRAPSDPRRRSR